MGDSTGRTCVPYKASFKKNFSRQPNLPVGELDSLAFRMGGVAIPRNWKVQGGGEHKGDRVFTLCCFSVCPSN